jgi:GNAT superfamily N-acetyltransferase
MKLPLLPSLAPGSLPAGKTRPPAIADAVGCSACAPAAAQCTLDALTIGETVQANDEISMRGVLYARLGAEFIGALDFEATHSILWINVLYVKPQYRRRGVASLLLAWLHARHPDKPVLRGPATPATCRAKP